MIETVPGLVTVLIPTFRSRELVPETLSSLKGQTGVEWDCVVSDDASDDGTMDTVRDVVGDDVRFRLVEQPRRLGAVGNWNAALAHARGEFVKLLCNDDLLYPGTLAEQAHLLAAAPTAVMATSRRDAVDRYGRTLARARGMKPAGGVVEGATALRSFVRTGTNLFGEPSFVLFRTDALRAAGGFTDGQYLTDVSSYAAILQRGGLVIAPSPGGAFRVHSASWTAALRQGQGRDTRACVRAVARQLDPAPSSADILAGLGRATVNAWVRRSAYAVAGLRDRYYAPRVPGE